LLKRTNRSPWQLPAEVAGLERLLAEHFHLRSVIISGLLRAMCHAKSPPAQI
jgi:hypothetical protein